MIEVFHKLSFSFNVNIQFVGNIEGIIQQLSEIFNQCFFILRIVCCEHVRERKLKIQQEKHLMLLLRILEVDFLGLFFINSINMIYVWCVETSKMERLSSSFNLISLRIWDSTFELNSIHFHSLFFCCFLKFE
jgi:hypothetical protein